MIDIDVKVKLKKELMNFCFTSDANKIVVFGPSGSGKTTLLKTISGFYRPESGKLSIRGKVFFDSNRRISLPIHKRKVGYLPQESTLFPNMTVLHNVLYSVTKNKRNSHIFEQMYNICDRLQIFDKLDSFPYMLSGGQQKRVALARVLMMRPDILLLDEPFSALDSPIRECLRGIVSEVSDEMDIPVIFVCHDIEDSFSSGKELVIIHKGKVLEYGDIEKVFNNPKNHITARLLNFENIWQIQSVEDNFFCKLKSKLSDTEITLNLLGTEINKEDYICVEANRVKFVKDVKIAKNLDKINLFKAKVKSIHPRGNYNKIVLDINGFVVFASAQDRLMKTMSISIGKELDISMRPENLIICKY